MSNPTTKQKKTKNCKNIKENLALIWKIADILHGTYKPHEYRDSLLPL